MIDRAATGAEAMQMNAIVGEACRQAIRWQMHRTRGFDFVPPLFAMGGVELPIVPRVALPQSDGPVRREARR
jgi:hypothetical protein